MRSVFWLIPNQVAGRPGPTWEPWSLLELRAGGIDSVLNLSEHEPDPAEFEAAGLYVYWTPLPTTVPPDAEAELACLKALPRAQSLLESELASGRRVLVHCVGGRDRTGMLFTYHIARTQGIAAAQALSQVRRVRPDAISAAGWESMTVRIIARLLVAA